MVLGTSDKRRSYSTFWMSNVLRNNYYTSRQGIIHYYTTVLPQMRSTIRDDRVVTTTTIKTKMEQRNGIKFKWPKNKSKSPYG
jgi:hypothetical protein